MKYYCLKCNQWICEVCKQNSFHLRFIYNVIFNSYCQYHYQKHFKVIIHYWRQNIVTLIDPITKIKKSITLNKSINNNSDSILVGNGIFINGGYPASSETHQVDFKNNTLIEKKSIRTPKYAHSLCNANDYIYSIGGYNDSTSMSDCEQYSITQNVWKDLPNLQTSRYACASFVLTHIYCLCGFNAKIKCLNSMEKLRVKDGKWEYVKVLNMLALS